MLSKRPSRRTSSRKPGSRRRRGQQTFEFRTWGGKREGSGRKPAVAGRPGVSHRPRPELPRRLPLHVTLRMAPHVYNLRSRRSFSVIERALRAGGDRFDVRIISFSVQGNHIHLLVESPDRAALGRALKGLSVRIARGLNHMMKRRGRVLGDRYHSHLLHTPTEVKRAIAYIRDNARKHAAERGEIYSAGYVDRYSSRGAPQVRLPPPETWLLKEGWTRATK